MIRAYTVTLAALLALLALTVAAAFTDIDRHLGGHGWSMLVALTIAIGKAVGGHAISGARQIADELKAR